MSTSIFKSKKNKGLMLDTLENIVQNKYHIRLGSDFERVFGDIMVHVQESFKKKSSSMSDEKYLEEINKECIKKAIEYISGNLQYFRKPEPEKQTSNQNIYRGTEDTINQAQMQQTNFQMPINTSNQQSAEQAFMLAAEQRRKDTPFVTAPSYKQQGSDNFNMGGNGNGNGNMGGNATLMSIILSTPTAMQNPSLVPSIINEIMQMQHLVDMMTKDFNMFRQQVTNHGFLEMIITSIRNKGNSKMKPMSLVDADPVNQQQQQQPENILDYSKIVTQYNNTADSPNRMNQFIPPSDQLVNNTLPDLDSVHLIDYQLSLDFRTDLDTPAKNQYPLKFVKFGNISKVELVSCRIPENDALRSEPYIYIKIPELGGRCYTSNHDVTFGKLNLSKNENGYLHYVPDNSSCIQKFSQPATFQKFTVSLLGYTGKSINLQEISILKTTKLKKQNKIKFNTLYKHKLNKDDLIDVLIYKTEDIDSYQIQVDEVIDENNFIVDNSFETLSEHIVVQRHVINCSFMFKLYEINWNLIMKKNLQNAQMIRLSELVNEHKKESSGSVMSDGVIINYVKTQVNPPQSQVPQVPQMPQFKQ